MAVRLAFDEAEGYARDGTSAGGNAGPKSGPVTGRAAQAPEPEKMREPLQRMARTLSGLIDRSMTAKPIAAMPRAVMQ